MRSRGQTIEPPPERVSTPGERHARRADRDRPAAPEASRRRPKLPRRRPGGSRRSASTVLIAAGAFLVGDAGATLAWEEPVTHFFTVRQQAVLAADLDALRAESPTRVERRALAGLRGTRER
ncbi:MAG: hypothetical protein M3417_11670, partial [Actinomycetota bacterium]|nr:hypothetical protein [Actinomycetota bacterium]